MSLTNRKLSGVCHFRYVVPVVRAKSHQVRKLKAWHERALRTCLILTLPSTLDSQVMSSEEKSKTKHLQSGVQMARKSKAFGVKLPRNRFSLCDLGQVTNFILPPCLHLETKGDVNS